MKWYYILIISIAFAGCASAPPKNKANACLMLLEKEEWKTPLKKAARTWGIPKHTILSIIYHESKFISDAQPPRRKFLGIGLPGRRISSAYGYSQALDATWEEYQRKRGGSSARRSNFEDSVDFIGWYLNRSVKRLGLSRHNAYYLYLAYHQGDGGFKRRSYLGKPTIMNYAKKVQRTANRYRRQMKSCS